MDLSNQVLVERVASLTYDYPDNEILNNSTREHQSQDFLFFAYDTRKNLNFSVEYVRLVYKCEGSLDIGIYEFDGYWDYTLISRELLTSKCDGNLREEYLDKSLFQKDKTYMLGYILKRDSYVYLMDNPRGKIKGYLCGTVSFPNIYTKGDLEEESCAYHIKDYLAFLDFLSFECDEDGYYGQNCSNICGIGMMCPNGIAQNCSKGEEFQNKTKQSFCYQCDCNYPNGGYCNTNSSKCFCNEYYNGKNCKVTNCYGKSSDDNNVCNGKGKCLVHDECSCNNGFFGKTCEEWKCNGINASSDLVCSKRGKCGFKGICHSCKHSYGTNCETPFSDESNDMTIEIIEGCYAYIDNVFRYMCTSQHDSNNSLVSKVYNPGKYILSFEMEYYSRKGIEIDSPVKVILIEYEENPKQNKRSVIPLNITVLRILPNSSKGEILVDYGSRFFHQIEIFQMVVTDKTLDVAFWNVENSLIIEDESIVMAVIIACLIVGCTCSILQISICSVFVFSLIHKYILK